MRKPVEYIETVLDAVLLIIFTIMVVSIIYQVFARYVIMRPTVWSEELARYLMVWTTMLGSALVLRRGGHVAVTALIDILPVYIQRVIAFVRDIIVIFMAGYIAYFGYDFAMRGGARTSSGLDIPMTYPYMALPIGGALIALFVVFSRVAKEGGEE